MKEHPGKADLPIFTKWLEFLYWLQPVIEKFPRRVRFTLSNRIEYLLLDVIEDLVEARYSRDKISVLKHVNLQLEKMRVLLRISHQRQFLSHNAFQHAIRQLAEIGSMLGGWIKQQEAR